MVKEWRTATIRDVSTIFGRIGFRGYTKKDIVDFYEGAISLSPSNLKDGKIMTDNSTFISWDKYNESPEIKIQIGDVVLVKTGSTYGKSAYVDSLTWATTLNPQIVVFKNIKINSKLFAYLIQTPEFKKQINSTVVGGAIPTLSQNQVYRFQIVFPKNSSEQQRIAEALSDVDGMISSLEKLVAKYKSIKTACLQQMFPQNGETVPRMRLPGFTGAWEQRKLGDIADIVGGGTPSTGNPSYWDGEIDWYAPAEITDQIYANSSQKKITALGYENSSAKMLPPGTVLFTSRAGIGKTAILTRKGCTNQGFQSIVPHRGELDSYFIFSRTEELKRYGELVGAGSTFVEVSGKQMAVMELMMPPTMREQQTIGGFFQQLDNLITLHQRKLEKVQKIKQGMMQQLLTGKIRLV